MKPRDSSALDEILAELRQAIEDLSLPDVSADDFNATGDRLMEVITQLNDLAKAEET